MGSINWPESQNLQFHMVSPSSSIAALSRKARRRCHEIQHEGCESCEREPIGFFISIALYGGCYLYMSVVFRRMKAR